MSTHDEPYSNEETQHFRAPGQGEPDPHAPAGRTDLIDPYADLDDEDEQPETRWHVGLDLGLLILRVAVGGTMLLNGLYKFGMFGGPGIDAWPGILQAQGFTSQTEVLSWVLALTEVGAGGALILGLFTPLAAAGVLGVTASATYLTKDIGYFPQLVEGGAQIPGYALPLLIGAGALALLFTGPGRIGLDVGFPWRKRPLGWGIFGVVLAAAAVLLVFALFR
ncbi:MAG: DoxX family protein [Thermocrispum sp.]